MKVEDYIKQHSELLQHPEETAQIIENLRPYRIDCLYTFAYYLFSFAENINASLENLFKQCKTSIDNQNKVRKIANEICQEAKLIPKNITIAVKSDLYKATQTDNSFLYLQKILEDDLGLKKHSFNNIFTDKALKRSIEEAIKDDLDTATLSKKSLNSIDNNKKKQVTIRNQNILILDKYTENKVLENYHFWNNIEIPQRKYINIFKGITQQKFLEMVCNADFSEINAKGISQRIKCNVYVLSRLLNDNEWGEKAAGKLNTTLADCQKRTEFIEWELLKTTFLQ